MSQPSRPRSRHSAAASSRYVKFDATGSAGDTEPAWPRSSRRIPLTGGVHGGDDADEHGPGDRHGLGEHGGDHSRHDGADHVGVGADADLVVRRRYRHDRGRARRSIRRTMSTRSHAVRATMRPTVRSTDPGVIYRVDPATGQASVFFDLNTVISQIDPGNATPTTPAANGLLGRRDGAGQLVQHHLRFRRGLQRHAGDVRRAASTDPIPARTSSSRSRPTAR